MKPFTSIVLAILLAVLLVSIFSSPSVAQTKQISASNTASSLLLHERKFLTYGRDFVAFAKGQESTALEYDIASDLAIQAGQIYDRLNKYEVLLNIYASLICAEDRSRTRRSIEGELQSDRKQMKLSIEAINLAIANTEKPGIAAEAIQMRDDVRKVEYLLAAVTFE